MPQKGDLCCICLTKSSSRFTLTSNFESELLQQCFGLTETREGKLCNSCRRVVHKFRTNPQRQFNSFVDSKGQKHITNEQRLKNTGKALTFWNCQNLKLEKDEQCRPDLVRPTLEQFSNEVLLKILSFLSAEELIAVQAVSQRFFNLCIDFDNDLWLPIVRRKHEHLHNHIVKAAAPVSSWKSIYFLFDATTDYVSNIEERNERATQYFISRNLSLQSELDNALDKSEQTSKELKNLRNVSGDSLSVEQEQMFTSIVKLKFRRSATGTIQAKNAQGRPTNLVSIRTVEVGSAEASSSTLRERSKFFERLETVCSTKNDTVSDKPNDDVNKQRASLMKRNTESYLEASKVAGLTIFNKFRLEHQTALSLKKEMPLNLWKTIKRSFKDSFGIDIMGTERELLEGLKQHGEFEYEVGEFVN